MNESGPLPEAIPEIAARLATAPLVEEPENAATVRPLLRHGEGASSFSVTWVCLAGHHRRLRTQRSVRCYYVLSGTVTCTVGDGSAHRVDADELLVVPARAAYALDGEGTYLVWNVPAFEPGDDEYLE